MPRLDYFAILGVSPGATAEEIKKAYRQLVFKYHPDRNRDDPAAEAKIRDINAAYEILSEPDSRLAYERLRYGGYHPSRSSVYETAEEETSNPSAVLQAMEQKLQDEARQETFRLLLKNVSKIKQELAVIRQRVVELQGYDSFRHEIVMARGEEAIQDLISTEMARKRQHLVDVALQMMLAQGVAPSNNETQVQVLRAQLDRVYERGWVQGYVHACELFYARR